VNTIGLILTIIPLYVSRYVLGFDSLLADNISANILGVGLALVFRFIANRVWVFTASRPLTND
jgi:putative flippase GtrA